MVKREVADSCTMPDGGASFVDVNLKVIVRQATGTGIAFQPDHMHGTTEAHGATSWSISHVFSQRVVDMIRDASDADLRGIFPEQGAGEGNPANPAKAE